MRFLKVVIPLVAVIAFGYYSLVIHSPQPGEQTYSFDLAEIRAMANSLHGAKPESIRAEKVATMEFAEAMVVAGEPWEATQIPVYVYQLVFDDQTIVVDAGMSRAQAEMQPDFMLKSYSDEAWRTVVEAMDKASMIVVTHEHFDHLGGIADHPRAADLVGALRLTEEQLGNADGMYPAEFQATLLPSLETIQYQTATPIAPGVVLIKSPGHTPGSQMVYVQLADGRELLLIGDVAWQMQSITMQRERPLFMTLLIGEDRHAVLAQFAALKELMEQASEVAVIPGHDHEVVDALIADGLIQNGFR